MTDWRIYAELLGKQTGKPTPPPHWWDDHKKRIAEQHPNYDDDKINRACGAIWFKIYNDARRERALIAEALGREE